MFLELDFRDKVEVECEIAFRGRAANRLYRHVCILMSWDWGRPGGMVLVQDQEWPPHFTELERGFGSNGVYAVQERNELHHPR